MTEVAKPGGRVLDAPSAVEFMREALVKIRETEISDISAELEQRRKILLPHLTRLVDGTGAESDLYALWRGTFVARRRAGDFSDVVGLDALTAGIKDLVSGSDDVRTRFTSFDRLLGAQEESMRRDLAGEMLKLYDPDQYWLCSRWMWNPRTQTGSLPLVLVEGYDLDGADAGEIYLKVGDAVRVVMDTATEIGFQGMKSSRYAVDVYLCAIYGIYLYTVTRMRMTQEFNKVIPRLPELVRRMLGVHRLEVSS